MILVFMAILIIKAPRVFSHLKAPLLPAVLTGFLSNGLVLPPVFFAGCNHTTQWRIDYGYPFVECVGRKLEDA